MTMTQNLELPDERFFNELETSLMEGIERISRNPKAVLEVEAKKYIRASFPHLDKIYSLDKNNPLYVRTISLIKGLLDFSVNLAKEQKNLFSGNVVDLKSLPSLNQYDNYRDWEGQYRAKYGKFQEEEIFTN